MMIKEFGEENSLEAIKENLQVIANDDLAEELLHRINSLKIECGITNGN